MTDYNIESENEIGSSGSGNILVNIVAGIFVLGALGVVALLVVLLVLPDDIVPDIFGSEASEPTPTLASVALLPTFPPTAGATAIPTETPTEKPIGNIPATNTPLPRMDTPTPAPINTLQPTLTPSPSSTLPPATPTKTPTPTPTDTATPGPSPTVTTTRSPFPFTKDLASPQYLQNYANNAGCDWMGIAGIVLDLNGNPVPNGEYRVHVWDSGIDERVVVGNAPAYGPSGYEQFLYNQPRFQEHNVQLETINGTAVSQVYRIQTRTSCNQNLIRFDLIQNH
jgi:hypothetical protein